MTTSVKGKLLRGDQALYDGVNALETRRDSTGGTIAGLPVGDAVDVLQIFGDGEVRTQATIKQATSILGSRNRTLHFAVGTWTITANTTIAGNFTCYIPAGCVFDVASGVTLTFSGLVFLESSTWTSGSGTVARGSTVPLPYKHGGSSGTFSTGASSTTIDEKLDRRIETKDFALSASGLSSAITAAGSGGRVIVNPGTYELVTISASNITLEIEDGAEFKVPDGDIVGGETSGTPALHISGDNVTIQGAVYCNGNKANQTTTSFVAANRDATFKVSGDNVTLDDVYILNAFWDGFTFDGGSTSGAEAKNLRIGRIRVKDPANRAGTLWAVDGYEIDSIYVDCETLGNGDHRIRFGNDSSDTSECLNGYVGHIRTPNNAVIIEQDTKYLEIGSVRAMSCKTEENSDIHIGSVVCHGLDDSTNSSFSIVAAQRIRVDSIAITGHAGSTSAAAFIQKASGTTEPQDIQIGRFYCQGAASTAHGLWIQDAVRLYIGSVISNGNGGRGLFVDQDAAYTQSDIWIDSIHATGNTSEDVRFETGITRSGYGHLTRGTDFTKYVGIAANAHRYPFGVQASVTATILTDTFTDGDVTVGTDRVTLTSHPFTSGQLARLFTSGTLPAGLALATNYYIKSIDANTVEFYSDSALTSIVDITAAAGGGTHTIVVAALTEDYNIDTVVETSTGSYTVTYTQGVTDDLPIVTGEDAQTELGSATGAAAVVLCRDGSGTATRPTSFRLVVFQADQDNL